MTPFPLDVFAKHFEGKVPWYWTVCDNSEAQHSHHVPKVSSVLRACPVWSDDNENLTTSTFYL